MRMCDLLRRILANISQHHIKQQRRRGEPALDPNTQGVEARGSGLQSQPWLHGEFEASLG